MPGKLLLPGGEASHRENPIPEVRGDQGTATEGTGGTWELTSGPQQAPGVLGVIQAARSSCHRALRLFLGGDSPARALQTTSEGVNAAP